MDHECATSEKFRSDLIARMLLASAELAGDNDGFARRLVAEQLGFCWAESWILSATVGASGVQTTSVQASRRPSTAQSRLLKALTTHVQIEALESRHPRRTAQNIDMEFRNAKVRRLIRMAK